MNIIFNNDDNTHKDTYVLGKIFFSHAVQEAKLHLQSLPRYQIVSAGALIFFVRVQVLKQTWIQAE